jgi:DNA polymerase IV (DinB-like DNA polymerase)
MSDNHPTDRLILHADMDAFFAAVEERENPSLKGKPVIIGSDPKGGAGRGIVATANYEARKYGVGSALPISTAYRRCPHGVYLRPNGKLYRAASKAIMEIFAAHADIVEQVSVDEAYLDCSSQGSFEAGRDLARLLQREILEQQQLSVSIGVAPNKLIAKIASEHKKPAGITVVIPARIAEFLDPKPVRALRGVGPKTAEHLREMGFTTVKDLRAASQQRLERAFGKFGAFLWNEVRGIDDRPVDPEWETKSMGRENTFAQDSEDDDEIRGTLLACVDRVYKDLQEEQLWAHTLTVKIRYQGFETHSKQTTLNQATGDRSDMRRAALTLLAPFLMDERPLRLVGFTASRLVPPEDLLPLGKTSQTSP